MRNIIILLIFSTTCYSQSINYEIYLLTFEDTSHYGRLFIDTISSQDNIWQIGPPQKKILNNAMSQPNTIITDTINSYPINDSSVFIIIHRVSLALAQDQKAVLSGYYKVDTDSIDDFGVIEISYDNGSTWLDMLNDPSFNWEYNKPVLTGRCDWNYFYVSFDDSGYDLYFGDTVQFKFTFISDSIQNNKDGLMFDNLDFTDFYEGGFSDITEQFKSKIYPNPSQYRVTIQFENRNAEEFNIRIFDLLGKLVYEEEVQGEEIEINTMEYKAGIYFYHLKNYQNSSRSFGKFIVE